jgi:hypothetical protein
MAEIVVEEPSLFGGIAGSTIEEASRHGWLAVRSMRPWHNLYKTKRWNVRRRAQLRSQPLCGMCHGLGIIKLATVADHVVPHRGNRQLFFAGELQSLCKSHHDRSKQGDERRGYSTEIGVDGVPVDPAHPTNRTRERELIFPRDLRPSILPLIMVCGPPAAGKSTYVKRHSSPGDMVIDLDQIVAEHIGAEHVRSPDPMVRDRALLIRNDMLRSLSSASPVSGRTAWFITTAASPASRRRWEEVLGVKRTIIVDTPLRICIDRIRADPSRSAVARDQERVARDWWGTYHPRTSDVTISSSP